MAAVVMVMMMPVTDNDGSRVGVGQCAKTEDHGEQESDLIFHMFSTKSPVRIHGVAQGSALPGDLDA